MKIEIDSDFLINNALGADEYVLLKLLSQRKFDLIACLPITPDIEALEAEGWLDVNGPEMAKLELTEFAYAQLNLIQGDDLNELAVWIRAQWENTKPGAMSSLSAIKNRLDSFVRAYSQFDIDTIKVACQVYIDRERANSEYKYLKTTINFIMEIDPLGETISKLADFCETVIADEGVSDNYTRA